jgi:hypothetical protein
MCEPPPGCTNDAEREWLYEHGYHIRCEWIELVDGFDYYLYKNGVDEYLARGKSELACYNAARQREVDCE